MTNDYRKAAWGIASDPFYPEELGDGTRVQKDAWTTELKPAIDEQVMRMFSNVYDWSHSPLLEGLSKTEGIANFPTYSSLPSAAPMLVIISGPSHSGLDSLANLIAFKIAGDKAPAALIDSRVRLDGRDPSRNVVRVASAIIDDVEYDPSLANGEILAQRMRDRLDRAVKTEASRTDATYSDVFSAFEKILAPTGRRVLIRILGGGDHDSWARIYKASKDFGAGVIVTTPETAYAKTCFDAMSTDKQNVTWIRATLLDRAKTELFVAERLAAVRVAGHAAALADLHPFTAQAVGVLFERGSQSGSNEIVAHPVGWIRQTLHHAIEEALQGAMAAVPSDQLHDIAACPHYPFAVDEARVIAARNRLNRGVRA